MIKTEVLTDGKKLIASDTILSQLDSRIAISLYVNEGGEPISLNITFMEVKEFGKNPINTHHTESSLDLIIEVKPKGQGALRKPIEIAVSEETGESLYLNFRLSPSNGQVAFSYNVYEAQNEEVIADSKGKKNGKK